MFPPLLNAATVSNGQISVQSQLQFAVQPELPPPAIHCPNNFWEAIVYSAGNSLGPSRLTFQQILSPQRASQYSNWWGSVRAVA